jgi:hypothetical protein
VIEIATTINVGSEQFAVPWHNCRRDYYLAQPLGFITEVGGEIVMLSIERGRYFGLDQIGSDIWKRFSLIGRI